MSKYVWPHIFKEKLRGKFRLDKNGYIKYPEDITEILNILEDAVREKVKEKLENE